MENIHSCAGVNLLLLLLDSHPHPHTYTYWLMSVIILNAVILFFIKQLYIHPHTHCIFCTFSSFYFDFSWCVCIFAVASRFSCYCCSWVVLLAGGRRRFLRFDTSPHCRLITVICSFSWNHHFSN